MQSRVLPMLILHRRSLRKFGWLSLAICTLATACSGSDQGPIPQTTGGSDAIGGATATGGSAGTTGGALPIGRANATGGSSSVATGGKGATGGASNACLLYTSPSPRDR